MKQLILLLDGTWDDADVGACDTNIVRLRTILDRSLDGNSAGYPSEDIRGPLTHLRTYQGDDVEHVVFYERGVGTGVLFDAVAGGAFGDGLNGNIRRAYKFISFHYEPGDQIYIFGFSRGAFTARSVAGYIAAAGLLRREACTAELEQQAWEYYRCPPSDRLPGAWSALTPHVWPREALVIEALAVFDTVGALGIPLKAFMQANRAKYGFHDVENNPIVRNSLQALAIDEHRAAFEATVWHQQPFRTFSGRVEQVWFAGAHGDIGGAIVPELTRETLNPHSLDDLSLDWMLKRLNALCPSFPINRELAWKHVDSAWSLARQNEPRQGLWRLLPLSLRAIANVPAVLPKLSFSRVGNYDRHAMPLAEMVHVSVIERLGSDVVIANEGLSYQPANLMRVLDHIYATYGAMPGLPKPRPEIRIVDWNGRDLDPFSPDERARAVDLLLAARTRLRTTT